jgi:tetratricopeptide (TPR) repeat protein
MGGVGRLGLVWVLLSLSASARAQNQDGSDLETARRHFRIGAERYDAGDYRGALEELLTAQRLHRVPAFDFNIGRCYDKLGETRLAIEHYERYAATEPPDVSEVRTRIAELKRQLALTTPGAAGAATAARPKMRRRTLAIVLGTVGGAVVVGTAVALGVTLSRSPDYSSSTLGPMQVTP